MGRGIGRGMKRERRVDMNRQRSGIHLMHFQSLSGATGMEWSWDENLAKFSRKWDSRIMHNVHSILTVA